MVVLLCSALLGQASMFSKIVPNPTGTNGYEEYLRAADLASNPLFYGYEAWLANLRSPTPAQDLARPDDVALSDPDLTVRRKWFERFRRCCNLVSRGNLKPVADPRGSIGPETTFPEFQHFKALVRLEANAAHVEFADGQTGVAVRQIEDALTFGDKIGGRILISRLVGIACDAMTFLELDDHWFQLSVTDARELETFLAHELNGPTPLAATLRGEEQAAHAAVEELFAKPVGFATEWGVDRNQQALARTLAKMGPVDAQATQDATNAVIDAYYGSILTILRGPEARWLTVKDVADGVSGDSKVAFATRVADIVLPTLSQVLIAEARNRTQVRLAYLTAKAVEYRWVRGHLPDRIEDFTTAEERVDPTSGHAFRYRRDGPWFRITREGKDSLGGVSLFKPPAPFDPNVGTVNP
ncbi:MAG: hypothetical protein ACYC96_13035 [Fimbriimonadaceae bacterium]